MPRTAQVVEIPGVVEAIATKDPFACATRVAKILASGADRVEVVRTATLAVARRSRPTIPPPHALLALGAALDLSARFPAPELPIVQACALAAAEWRDAPLELPRHAVTGDELHLGRSFLQAVRTPDPLEADVIFAGLLREGEERRFAGDTLFETCAQDIAADGHKLTFAVGSWRLARSLGWLRGDVLLRPAVRVAAATPQDLSEFSAVLREVGRARLDLELAGRNVMEIDATVRYAYGVALQAGPDRIVAELIAGLKRGRAPAGYVDLVAASAAERLITDPAALEPTLLALATRFVLGFSRTAYRVLALFLAARRVASVEAGDVPSPAPIADPAAALRGLENAIEADDAREAVRLALGLADKAEPADVARILARKAALQDAYADAGHSLLYASWATEFASVAPRPALASLAAVLARAPKSHTIAEGS